MKIENVSPSRPAYSYPNYALILYHEIPRSSFQATAILGYSILRITR